MNPINYPELYRISRELKDLLTMLSQVMDDPTPRAKLEKEIAELLEDLKLILE